MIAKALSVTTFGIGAHLVYVEVDLASGLPQTTIVGLPDQAIRESKERVKSAIRNSGFPYSSSKLTINLAPADLKKEGPSFDLAIAIGILTCCEFLPPQCLKEFIFIGELALDGSLRPVRGALSAAELAAKLKLPLIIPKENAREAGLIENAVLKCAANLKDVVDFLRDEKELETPGPTSQMLEPDDLKQQGNDFSEVKGQWHAKRAMEVAASGDHNLLFIGPPGSGKTMLARRLAAILPPITHEDLIQVSKIYSVAGLFHRGEFLKSRPFRAPHHTISQIGLAGGGSFPKPGEISLAHGGVLFLDEFPEFHRDVIEVLRGPLEEGTILISRAKQNLEFPAKFLLICAMNPCPCGYLTSRKRPCRCSLGQIQRYLNKVSGPIFDRIDIHLEVPAMEYRDLASQAASESSAEIRKRVLRARTIQKERFGKSSISVNSQMHPNEIKKYCELNQECRKLLEQAMQELGFSARGYHKVIKIARTIADLAESELISVEHIAEALQYRSLDRNYFR